MQKEGGMLTKRLAFAVALLALLLTGCPSNHYVIQLTPHGAMIERQLLFYYSDGVDTNGAPNYQVFPTTELVAIAGSYPSASLKRDGEQYTVVGEFGAVMPQDVGGSGAYTNLMTSLGGAGFYSERFRGNDDLASAAAKRLRAADQLADLVLGWSRMALGRERNYEKLRRFLNVDFRNDVKNFGLYAWLMQAAEYGKPGASEEFGARLGQYLLERGYLKPDDLPDLFLVGSGNEDRMARLVQRLVAAKLGLPKSAPIPPALAFLNDAGAMEKSWTNYLSTTDQYRVKLRHWQKEKVVHELGVVRNRVEDYYHARSGTNATALPPLPPRPDPEEVADDLIKQLIQFNAGTDDHLTVRLALDAAPAHSNGKWDNTLKQVVWESDLAPADQGAQWPALCYASWSQPNAAGQTAHFGKVILSGDELSQYCLWRSALDKSQSAQWDALLSGLKPGPDLNDKLKTFRFSTESSPVSAIGRSLILSGLGEKP